MKIGGPAAQVASALGQVPALAAGAAGAAISWEDAKDLQRAANAGLVPQAEADEKQFWAVVEGVLVGIHGIGPGAKAFSKLSTTPVGKGALAILRSLLPKLARAAGTALMDEQLIAPLQGALRTAGRAHQGPETWIWTRDAASRPSRCSRAAATGSW